jgi:hypothetical protein
VRHLELFSSASNHHAWQVAGVAGVCFFGGIFCWLGWIMLPALPSLVCRLLGASSSGTATGTVVAMRPSPYLRQEGSLVPQVRFSAGDRTVSFAERLTAESFKPGTHVQVTYAPWWPAATATIVPRGTILRMLAMVVLSLLLVLGLIGSSVLCIVD